MKFNGKSLPEKRLYPSPTAGDGRLRANSARSGAGQGKGSSHKYVSCKQCGFTVDKSVTDHSGGTLSGDSGYGPVTKTAGDAVTDLISDTFTDGTQTKYPGTGEQTVKKGAGCPMCGSKNFSGGK